MLQLPTTPCADTTAIGPGSQIFRGHPPQKSPPNSLEEHAVGLVAVVAISHPGGHAEALRQCPLCLEEGGSVPGADDVHALVDTQLLPTRATEGWGGSAPHPDPHLCPPHLSPSPPQINCLPPAPQNSHSPPPNPTCRFHPRGGSAPGRIGPPPRAQVQVGGDGLSPFAWGCHLRTPWRLGTGGQTPFLSCVIPPSSRPAGLPPIAPHRGVEPGWRMARRAAHLDQGWE